ncbi:OrdA protein [Mycena indigotica]|uniref:OrdA protein n=1 Tax=Mycena indigotica TaxID=2126181 RepID=A0A8H6SDG0_9AGAR|nr:OrdA protein [Mycena indigotica]KAF7297433.1 OrdA protein [Mycena indigotica]
MLAILAGAFTVWLLLFRFRKRRAVSLPPGPPGLPILGNVLDMPSVTEWLTFAEWAKYGGLCSVTFLGQPMIILNSASAMEELDGKGPVFNTRPRLPMAGELVGYNQTLVLMPYGPQFRVFRKHFARLIGTPAAARQFVPLVELETNRFLKRLLLKPNAEFIDGHLRKLTGAIILRLTYGIEVQDEDDPFVTLIEKANGNFSAATTPGAFLVDIFPSLLLIPETLAPFKRKAKAWAIETKKMVESPYSYTRRQIAAGTAPTSFVSRLLEDEQKLNDQELHDVKYTAGSFYGGGADTTAALLHAFFLAMVLYPEVQRRAQREIDDLLNGVPHAAMEDTILNGYWIPKGSIIIANIWNMLNDPQVYPAPEVFDPTRYLPDTNVGTTQRDPRHACFGFSRRICPGRELAEISLFSSIAAILATFDIERASGPLPKHENTQGTISHPKPFDCVATPFENEPGPEFESEITCGGVTGVTLHTLSRAMTRIPVAMALRSALIIVDLQEDFCPPNGSLAVAGGRDIVPVINTLLASSFFDFRVATKDWHPIDHISFAVNHPPPNNIPFESFATVVNPENPDEQYETRLWPVHCVQGTPGAELAPELNLERVDKIVEKGMDKRVEMYSAFYDPFTNPTISISELGPELKKNSIDKVYVVGLAMDYCVRATALDAVTEGYEVYLIEDATKAVDPAEGWDNARAEMEGKGIKFIKSVDIVS